MMIQKIYILLFFIFFTIGSFAQRHTSYTVKEGETIDHIAKIYRVSPNDIRKLNPDAPENLRKGMLLVIPDFGVTHYSKQKPASFKSHSVKGQETLFGLTHRYNITIDDIKRYNQELYTRELQVGEEITIPVFSEEISVVEKGRPGLKKHVVAPGEGLWRIAKNYNVTQNVLEKLNPGITENLVEGQEIWVPSGEVERDTKTREGMVLYRVEKGEGFMSLQRKFGLTEGELIGLNPELREGIKLDAEIWIPKERFYQSQNQDSNQSTFIFEDSNQYVLERSIPENVHHIAYILPFRLGSQSNTNFYDLRQKLQNDKLTQIASDFYLGAKIAMDSLAKRGYKFKALVLDSDASSQGIRKALQNPELEKAQVIIGPFLPKVFNELSQNITNPSTALLVPVSNSSEIELRPNVYQTIPNLERQKEAMIEYINNSFKEANILVITDGKNQIEMEKVASNFPNGRLVTNIENKNLLSLMSNSKDNIVIIDSNNLVFLSDLVRSLHSLQTSKNKLNSIRLVALDKGSAFDNNSLSNTQLSNLHFTYPTVNRFSGADNSFSKKYEEEYGILPNRYIIRGFDMTMDALLRLGVNPDFNIANKNINKTSYVENKFTYKPNFLRGGGFENMGVYIVEYDNLDIKELQQITPVLTTEQQ